MSTTQQRRTFKTNKTPNKITVLVMWLKLLGWSFLIPITRALSREQTV